MSNPTNLTTLISELRRYNDHQARRLSKLEVEEFYLLSYENLTDTKKRGVFKVSGSTKNVYTVTWYHQNSFFCDCPDQTSYCKKQNCVCKHVCFVLCRVGKIFSKEFFVSKKLTQEHADALGARLTVIDNTLIDNELAMKFSTMMQAQEVCKTMFKGNKPIDSEEDCPICYDHLRTEGVVKALVSCPCCANWMHQQCMKKWLETKDTCVMCRSDVWTVYKSTNAISNNYINLQS